MIRRIVTATLLVASLAACTNSDGGGVSSSTAGVPSSASSLSSPPSGAAADISEGITRHFIGNRFEFDNSKKEWRRENVTFVMEANGKNPQSIRITYPEGTLNCSADMAATGNFVALADNLAALGYQEVKKKYSEACFS